MDNRYRMDNDSVLVRKDVDAGEPTLINERLERSLCIRAMGESIGFYREFFGRTGPDQSTEELTRAYEVELAHARSLGLFAPGGVRMKDHLNYWCLGRVFAPRVYIESGVYIGSSLHAFIRCPGLEKVVAIDPNLAQLKVPLADIPGAVLIDDKDFSQLELPDLPPQTLVYFDDHINTANRIVQSHERGLKHLLFDDSTGFEGITQRLYPAIPTVPMIMNHDLLAPGDQMSWTFSVPPKDQGRKGGWRLFNRPQEPQYIRVTLNVSEVLIASCKRARKLIRVVCRVPDLGQFIPQAMPEKMVDTSKYLVELV